MTKFAQLFDPNTPDHPPGEESSPLAESATRPKSFTLLFVDDEPHVLSGLKRVFYRENYSILTANSGEEALCLMEDTPVQLIVTDYRMPGLLGSDLLKQIKVRWPETIRIMLTGHADVQAIMGAVNEGAVYKFMTKPCNDDALRLTVSLALEQYSLLQENKKLKAIAREQQTRIKKYSSVFDESKGILGSILVRAGAITQDQLLAAMQAKGQDEFLGDVLVRLGHATEAAIERAIQKSQNLESVNLKEIQISPKIAGLLPRELCEKNRLIPIRREGQKLIVAMADPSDLIKVDNIAMWTSSKISPVVAKSSDIGMQIVKVYGEENEAEEVWGPDALFDYEPLEDIDVIVDDDDVDVSIEQLIKTSGVPPIVRIVNAIISEALRNATSDIHIEPRTKYSVVRYRKDGMLSAKIRIPLELHPPTVSRVKILAKMDVAERRMPQDGRFTVRIGTQTADIRVSTLPTISGEKVVMRILDKGANVKITADLGMLGSDLQRLESLIRRPQGMVISTGPTGSGKTTTLYSILHQMLDTTKNYETIEDPVEYFLEDVNQVHVKESIGLSFAKVLRATLRQDPDVILVGEIRDADTADAAFKAALTGHMVLTTLHTSNSVAAITRLIDLGVKPYLIASALEGIIAQRLVRKTCLHCKYRMPADEKTLKLLYPTESRLKEVAVGKGCPRCNDTGYLGRVGLYEIFLVTEQFRQSISSSYRESEIMTLARCGGMRTLREDGLEKVRQGITTLDELLRVLGPPAGMKRPCMDCGQILDSEFSYCPHCGAYRRMVCRKCTTPLEEEWRLCPACGASKDVASSLGATQGLQ